MSPFAYTLKKYRANKKLQQKDLAEIIGCEPGYLSALETDAKVPPQKENLLQLLKKLNLSVEEKAEFLISAEKSKRSFKLPLKASMRLFEICHAFEKQISSP